MSQRTQHWLSPKQITISVDCNETDELLTQVSCVQGYHLTATPFELQGQPAPPQENLLAPYPSYMSDNMAPEHDHLPSQGLADNTDQFHLSFGGNELSSLGDVLWPLLIPSNGAAGAPTSSTTTDLSAHSPVKASTAGPRVIELVAAENNLRAVGSPRVQQAAGKRRKKGGIYQCQFRNAGCSATFTALHNLRYHLNAHQGLKPYKCRKCSYAADSPTTLKRHVKRHPSSYTGYTI